MLMLVTYDVNTASEDGNKRLRRVAKVCQDYGQRVQNSVFECLVNPAEFEILKRKLKEVINEEKDSVRFYRIGKNWQIRVETMGKVTSYDPEQDLLLF